MGQDTSTIDLITLLLLGCLGAFGLFILLTINPALFRSQLVYFIVSVGLLYLFSRLDSAIWWWFAPWGYVLSLIFLVTSFWGPNIRGATRWLLIGGIQLQPSEIVKPFLLLLFARMMSERIPRQLRHLPMHLVLFLLPFLLVFKQPDLGTALVYASAWIAMLVAGGLPLWLVGLTVPTLVVLLPVGWRMLAPYQKARILSFLYPALDPRGAGYNALQAMIAVGSGQLFGRGLGRGTQSHLRFLPEHHTDFIFATLVEELGLVGGVILLVIYVSLLWRIIKPLLTSSGREDFAYIYSMGLMTLILSQVFINAGMNMGIVPITGITLPFVSYGGSSLLSLGMAFGILWALRRPRREPETIAPPH